MEERALVKHRPLLQLLAFFGATFVGGALLVAVPALGAIVLAVTTIVVVTAVGDRTPPTRVRRGKIERVTQHAGLRVDISPRKLTEVGRERRFEVDLVSFTAVESRSASWRIAVGAWLRAECDDPAVRSVRALLGCVRFDVVGSGVDLPLEAIAPGLTAVQRLVKEPHKVVLDILWDERLTIADRIAAASCCEPADLARRGNVEQLPIPLVLPTVRRMGPRKEAAEALMCLATNPEADRIERVDAVELLERWGAAVVLRRILDEVEPSLTPVVRKALRNIQGPGGQLSIAASVDEGGLAFADEAGPGAVSIDDDSEDLDLPP
ncbi:MAG: hypothetical protein RL846_26885 [Deltaproteobacteria bacterium]